MENQNIEIKLNSNQELATEIRIHLKTFEEENDAESNEDDDEDSSDNSYHWYKEITELEDSDSEIQVSDDMVLNSSDSYPIVNIIPSVISDSDSDSEPNEVSYVVEFQLQPDGETTIEQKYLQNVNGEESDQDLTVSDFENNEENEAAVDNESKAEDDNTKFTNLAPKKSQTVTQAYMCNDCNYTSPKRNLFLKHIKCHLGETAHKSNVCKLQPNVETKSEQKYLKNGDGEKSEQDLTVSNFENNEDNKATVGNESKTEDDNTTVINLSSKKSQTVTQAYMCNDCDYTSPKRNLFLKHIKRHLGKMAHKSNVCKLQPNVETKSEQKYLKNGDGEKSDQHLTVSDFENNKDYEAAVDNELKAEDDNTRFTNLVPKKSQTVTQVYMCNDCNYTSPKRNLFLKHIKCHLGETAHKSNVYKLQHNVETKSDQKYLKNGDGEKSDQDLTLSDFENNEDNEATVGDELKAEDDNTTVINLSSKKSQTVTQAYMCNDCDYTSPKRNLFLKHIKSHLGEMAHKCNVCKKGFMDLHSLKDHVSTHTETKPSKLQKHIGCHTGKIPYKCPHCTYAGANNYKLKRHLLTHTGEKPYKRGDCNTRFTQSSSLKQHKRVQCDSNKPGFQCELCPTTSARKHDLKIHVQRLHTDKPFKCKQCGEKLPNKYSHMLHVTTHKGGKIFKCKLCPYASKSNCYLESHMLIHTGQKLHQCDNCSQFFRQKKLLKKHINLHHNPSFVPKPQEKSYQCAECGKCFRRKGILIGHMSVHNSDSSVQALKKEKQNKIRIIDGLLPRLILERCKSV